MSRLALLALALLAMPVSAQPADSLAARRASAEALVETFWARVWNPPHDLAAIDEMVTPGFVITSGGTDTVGRDAFREWVARFHSVAHDVTLDAHETFSNADATRVTSRWTAEARNGGMLGTPADGQPVSFTGIAVWEIDWSDPEAPRLAHNWVERSAWELYQQLTVAE